MLQHYQRWVVCPLVHFLSQKRTIEGFKVIYEFALNSFLETDSCWVFRIDFIDTLFIVIFGILIQFSDDIELLYAI